MFVQLLSYKKKLLGSNQLRKVFQTPEIPIVYLNKINERFRDFIFLLATQPRNLLVRRLGTLRPFTSLARSEHKHQALLTLRRAAPFAAKKLKNERRVQRTESKSLQLRTNRATE